MNGEIFGGVKSFILLSNLDPIILNPSVAQLVERRTVESCGYP
jgi:hypothetical protein